jgi:hypothetical protein
MNKALRAIAMSLLVICNAYGQDSIKVHHELFYKPTYDKLTLELNINPFTGELSLNNFLNQIKLRYFTASDFAIRVGFNVDMTKKDITTTNPYGTNPYTLEENKKTSLLGLNAGIEKHFAGTRRLSPYVGLELAVAFKSSSHVINDGSTETTIDNAWRTVALVNNSFVYGYEEKAYFQYGANLIAGFDFYVARHFFMGYEISYRFYNKEYNGVEITTVGTPFPQDNPDSNETEFSVGPNLLNGIRIGYVF